MARRGSVGGPDQGYAWAVAGACFLINFLLVGLARSVSLLYVALVEEFGVTRQQASLPFSLRVSLKSLPGPLIGLLGQRYGVRRVCCAGGFLSAAGVGLCYFAPSMVWITVFWGIVHGVGFGMANVIHMLIINHYFDKYKATVLGLAYSGDCFGTFAFPVILEVLLENYNVRGTFLILSGILLNVVPLAMILKKPPWQRTPERKSTRNDPAQNGFKEYPRQSVGYRNESFLKFDEDLSPFQTQEDEYCTYDAAYGRVSLHSTRQNSLNRLSVWSRSASSMGGSVCTQRTPSEMYAQKNDSLTPVYEEELAIIPQETCDVTLNDRNPGELDANEDYTVYQQVGNSSKWPTLSDLSHIEHDNINRLRSASSVNQLPQGLSASILGKNETDSEMNEVSNYPDHSFSKNVSLSDNEIFTVNVGQELILSVEHTANDDVRNGVLNGNVFFTKNGVEKLELSVNNSSCKDSKNEPSSGKVIFDRNGEKELMISVKEINFSDANVPSSLPQQRPTTDRPGLLKLLIQTNTKPIFFLISMTMAVYAYCFIGVGIVLIDYAGDQGIPHHLAKFLVIGFSVTDLIGRLCFGQAIDRKLIKTKNFVSVIMLSLGSLVACLPLNASFGYMIACMCLIGLAIGGAAIVYPILVNNYMDKSEEAVAMGCLNFYGGILALSMAPMIGYFRDHVGSYDGVFYIFGGLVVLVGVAWQFEPLILKWQNRPKNNQDWTLVTRL